MAESECLKTMDDWPYRSQLYFTNEKEELDYIADKISNNTNDGAWIGIRAMSTDDIWSNRYVVPKNIFSHNFFVIYMSIYIHICIYIHR